MRTFSIWSHSGPVLQAQVELIDLWELPRRPLVTSPNRSRNSKLLMVIDADLVLHLFWKRATLHYSFDAILFLFYLNIFIPGVCGSRPSLEVQQRWSVSFFSYSRFHLPLLLDLTCFFFYTFYSAAAASGLHRQTHNTSPLVPFSR